MHNGTQMQREQEEADIEGRHMLDLAGVELKEAAMRHAQVHAQPCVHA